MFVLFCMFLPYTCFLHFPWYQCQSSQLGSVLNSWYSVISCLVVSCPISMIIVAQTTNCLSPKHVWVFTHYLMPLLSTLRANNLLLFSRSKRLIKPVSGEVEIPCWSPPDPHLRWCERPTSKLVSEVHSTPFGIPPSYCANFLLLCYPLPFLGQNPGNIEDLTDLLAKDWEQLGSVQEIREKNSLEWRLRPSGARNILLSFPRMKHKNGY